MIGGIIIIIIIIPTTTTSEAKKEVIGNFWDFSITKTLLKGQCDT